MGLPEILMFDSLFPPFPPLNVQYVLPPHDQCFDLFLLFAVGHGDLADLDTTGLGSGNTKYLTGMVEQGEVVPYHVPGWTEKAMLQKQPCIS